MEISPDGTYLVSGAQLCSLVDDRHQAMRRVEGLIVQYSGTTAADREAKIELLEGETRRMRKALEMISLAVPNWVETQHMTQGAASNVQGWLREGLK